MSTRTKVLMIVLVLVSVFVLTGCGIENPAVVVARVKENNETVKTAMSHVTGK